jgi:hypothetical protein
VRIRVTPVLAGAFLAAWLTAVPFSRAQESEALMPEQSAAKALQLIQKAIDALGGAKYLNVRTVTCTGKLGQFSHQGDLAGYEKFVDYAVPPYKDRTENLPKRNIISIFDKDKGWILDRGGVADAPETDLAQFEEDIQKDIENVLRNRVHEHGMIVRYGGKDVVDLKEADWVELVDSENRTIRIAFARSNHLPIRKVVDTRDPKSQMKSEEVEYYSLFMPIDGIETPYQITRERNGKKVYQVFFDKCQYNADIPDSLFTKQSLEQRWNEVGKKPKNGKDKPDKNDKDDKDDKDSKFKN